ncbi:MULTISPECIES: ABC transporter ATP-binding protein [Dorea]|jgi:ATP-binding cassette subfamily B multidrug efflux pump|uniref:ABC transporter ATP-binding protein n=1 Tax=Dorea longicatena TaxID=88431 RepID=A0A414SQP1_9FIRM|nr:MULTISPECIES: ABC transporter ATP-binding protein [Dorea]RGU05591.1 ABC transporter ATP-binding protein [Dorea longicatena]RHG22617.1 ABC transporter ATP-binding protein [Dorea longicatena]
MGKLFKFLKPYTAAVAAIICILVVQAYCDLSLPTYTSDIVNVGIQQGGIDETVPDTISKKDLNHLLLLVPSDRQKTVKNAYTESVEKYDYNGTVMELKASVKEDEKKMDRLSEILGKPMLMAAGFDSGSDMTQKIEEQMRTQMSGIPNVDKMDIYDMLEFMGAEGRNALIGQMDQQMDSMQDSMIAQAAAGYIKDAYTHIGIDTDQIETTYILRTGAKMLALAFLGMAASILVGLLASRVGAGVGRRLRENVFRKVVGFSNAEFDKFSTASLITRSTNDIQQIQLLLVMILRMVLYAPIMAIGGIWKVFHTNVGMSWIIGLAVAVIIVIVGFLFLVVMPKFKLIQNQVDKLNLVSREILTGLSVIRAFGTQKHEEERFDDANKALTKTNLFVNRAMTFMMPLMMFVMNSIAVLIVWVGGHSINDGAMQVGDMMAFIQYTMQIIMAFLMICMISVMLPRAAVSAGRVDEVLTSETLIHDPGNPSHIPEEGKGKVVFDHVSFRYPGAEEDVLHDISFTAEPGKTTAFIGSTGCGKSTLVNLIPRFYDVTDGKITIDGKDIRNVSQHELREKLGYVPQKAVLFSGDIASNILYGNPEGSEAEMTEAATIAQATEFIEQKKKKYKSTISQGGSNVSGGQKQRLSIARAIAKHPDVYIFDDSFSALDYKTDATLRAKLKEKTSESTVMIVAQRISTILHADQIIVLDDGQIVGKGTHKELLKTCEAYYQIASSQLSEKELEEDLKEVESYAKR